MKIMNTINNLNKMNKRGFFFSLSAILIVLVIGSFLFYYETSQKERDFVEVQYVKHSQVSGYINDFSDYYLPSFIFTSAKLSIYGISEKINESVLQSTNTDIDRNLTNAVLTGHTDGSGSALTLVNEFTLPVYLNRTKKIMPVEFNFEYLKVNITSVEHVKPEVLQINSSVRVRLNASSNATISSEIRWANEINYSENISVIGFVDPQDEKLITGMWVENSSKSCFLRLIDSSYVCNVDGLSPP